MGLEQLSYEEKNKILNEFILSRDQLLDLTSYLNNINIFDVLKTKDYEIRHSCLNILFSRYFLKWYELRYPRAYQKVCGERSEE